MATIALIAPDSQTEKLVTFVQQHTPTLARYRLIAAEATGQLIQNVTGLKVELVLPELLGGTLQIAAEVAAGNVVAVFLLADSLHAQFQQADVQSLLQVCSVHNVPIATNLATAEAIAFKIAKTRVAYLIFNPVAGSGNANQELELVRQLLEPHLDLHIHMTTAETDPADLVKEAIANRTDLVIASGGDGTVSTVAGALIGTGVPLGIIPRGTANAFAATLGIPRVMPLRTACQVILSGQSHIVDAARINGIPMILLAGIGYEAKTVEKASRELKQKWGALAYLMAGWQELNEQSLFDAEIEAEGKTFRIQANAITIANAAPPSSMLAQGAGNVIFDDGLLDVTVTSVTSKMEAIGTMLNMLGSAITKTDPQQENIAHGRTRSIKVTTNPPQKVVVDGEIIGTTPVEVECIPQGLMVLKP
ncbi:methylglyoxal synthase [Leptolyngbya ohadii]|uniref:methylglyoxal synthase n=1 Tax=Leptolyngbya ohadii TaxID=1962290 RepID=UPI000B5A0485|nr:methylglyoxal synthase [Leptolyngbya ohadii]